MECRDGTLRLLRRSVPFPKGRKRDWFKSPVFQREFQLNHAKVVPGYPGASIQKGILRIQSYSANAKTGLHTWWKNVEEK